MEDANQVKLAPPGAGLPRVELLISRVLFALFRYNTSDAAALDYFKREGDKVESIYLKIPPERRSDRVLITRIQGLEDSSRHWSAALTLDHLAIVNFGVISLFKSLKADQPIDVISTANVKPTLNEPESALEKYRSSLREYRNYLIDFEPLKHQRCHPHPWFGPLNAHGWHCLAAAHLTIHKNQMRLISARLNL